jgi:hypothetical protein
MDDVLLAEAMLGQDAQEFVVSEVGRYLLGRAEQEAYEASDKLKRVSPWRRRRITELQNEIWRAESVKAWIVEIIQAGQAAEHALEQKE